MQPELLQWLKQYFSQSDISVQPCDGGKNNAAFRLAVNHDEFFLKQYHADESQRFDREVAFLRHMQQKQLRCVPQLIAADRSLSVALMTSLPGELPDAVSDDLVSQAARFISRLNVGTASACIEKNDNSGISLARGALLTPSDFFKDVQDRVTALAAITPNDNVDDAMLAFVSSQIQPVVTSLQRQCQSLLFEDLPFQRILSPSDFGFHNSLLFQQTLYFVDFEYAGWDSAEKLVTDFFAQPRYLIPAEKMKSFIATAFNAQTYHGRKWENLLHNCQLLLPVAQVKWSLIFLNEFKHQDLQRRRFSSRARLHTQVKETQLQKAKDKLNMLSMIEEHNSACSE